MNENTVDNGTSKRRGFDLSKVGKSKDEKLAQQQAAAEFISGASDNVPGVQPPVVDAAAVQETLKEDPNKMPWEGIDPTLEGRQIPIRTKKILDLKIAYVQQNTLGGISLAKIVRDSLEKHVDSLIEEINKKNNK